MVALIFTLLFASVVNAAEAGESPIRDHSRAELLYAAHCVACHDEQVHWRINKHADSWEGLKSEVQRWQGVLSLEWSEDDIKRVTHYLNMLYYHYPSADLLVHKP